jgi:uncharacterized protein (TIGR02186 family)
MRGWAALLGALLALWPHLLAGESLVSGVSRDDVQITADFTGSDILVYGAVRRDAPPPDAPPLHVIVTLEGPSETVAVRRKERRFGIWINGSATQIGDVPSYFAMASTGPVADILRPEEDLRHEIGIDRRLSVTRIDAGALDFPTFVAALLRIRQRSGGFSGRRHPVSRRFRSAGQSDRGRFPPASVFAARRAGD